MSTEPWAGTFPGSGCSPQEGWAGVVSVQGPYVSYRCPWEGPCGGLLLEPAGGS